jgi:hypothetical protein
MDIPDTTFRNGLATGHLNNNTAFVQEAPTNIDLQTNRSINAIKLSAKNLRVGFKSSDFQYKLGLITAKGSIDASISNITLDISIGLGTQMLVDGRMVPNITIPEVNLHIPKDKIDIKIHGNIIVAFANAFKSFFIHTMTDKIVKGIQKNV